MKTRLAVRAGQMRHTITISKAADTLDAAGERINPLTGTLTPVFSNLSASIEPLTGTEAFQAQQLNADITHKIRTRVPQGTAIVTPKMWVVFGSKRFDILSVVNVEERGKVLEMLCKEHC